MPDTPLNPDAIRELTEAIRLTVEYVGTGMLPAIPGWSWYDAMVKYAPNDAEVLRAMDPLPELAAALPEVTDMDGLRALPADTILEASGKMLDGTFHQCMIRKLPDFVTGTDGTVDPGFECLSYTSSQIVTEVFFPARVLYRPEVKP